MVGRPVAELEKHSEADSEMNTDDVYVHFSI